jgi:threonine/homoserine/homoserine lactone efflux protein
VGLGIMQLFDLYPLSYQVLKVLSVAYLLYLAYKIAMSGAASESRSARVNPMTFLQAVLFQWVNPKAWTMALTAISVYAPAKGLMSVVLVALVFGAINLPCISTWTALGQKMQRFLTNKKRLRLFNFSMASLLILSLYPVL